MFIVLTPLLQLHSWFILTYMFWEVLSAYLVHNKLQPTVRPEFAILGWFYHIFL